MFLSFKNIYDKLREKQIFDEDLYLHYLGIDVHVKQKVNPIRSNDPTCSFRVKHDSISDKYKWSDFGTTNIWCDIFDAISIKNNINVYEVLIVINKDYNLGLTHSDKYSPDIIIDIPVNNDRLLQRYKNKTDINLQVILNKHDGKHIFTKHDIKYWNQGLINKSVLTKENVFSVNTVLIDGQEIWTYHKLNPIYLYYEKAEHGNFMKLYRPLNKEKEYKWLSNIKEGNKVIGGLSSLQEHEYYLIITKSKKDWLVLKHIYGFNCIYVQSESTGIHEDIMNMLHLQYQYPVIYSLFDNDESGIKLNEEFAIKNDTIPIQYPLSLGIKDTWDNVVKYGIEGKQHILNLM